MRQQNIDPSYKAGNNFYFTYAIETTSWYCLPEPGSTVHIYFQNCNEFTGIAVHAMRSGSAAESGCVSAKGAIEDKSFSTEDGKAIQFTDTGIEVASVDEASKFTLSKDGTLNMEATDIVLSAQNELNLGKGDGTNRGRASGDHFKEYHTAGQNRKCGCGDHKI